MSNSVVTPLIEIKDYLPNGNRLFVKAEYLQPAGAAKARCVESMINAYIDENGSLEGKTVIESTSGNTGAALIHYSKEYGYKTVLVVDTECPETKVKKLTDAGAEVIVPRCPEGWDPRKFRMKTVKETSDSKGYIWLNQYDNPAAPLSHIHCAEEIASELDKVDFCFVAVGTGATFRGVMDGFKKVSPETVCIGVEPCGSHALGLETDADHFYNFGPGFHERAPYLEGVENVIGVQICDEDTISETRKLYKTQGLEAGLSTGMCVSAVIKQIEKDDIHDRNFVVIGADGIKPYLDVI